MCKTKPESKQTDKQSDTCVASINFFRPKEPCQTGRHFPTRSLLRFQRRFFRGQPRVNLAPCIFCCQRFYLAAWAARWSPIGQQLRRHLADGHSTERNLVPSVAMIRLAKNEIQAD